LVTLVSTIIIFGALVFFHELGHLIAAKKAGITVLEFALGFGPKIATFQKNDTTYSLRAVPLGGFCQMLGETTEDTSVGSFHQKPLLSRTIVVGAGSLMNFVLAALLFFVLYFFVQGIPLQGPVIGEVLPGSTAKEAGLNSGDVVVSIDEEKKDSWEQVVNKIHANPDTALGFIVEREGNYKEIGVTPQEDPNTGRGMIGVSPKMERFALWNSLTKGVEDTVLITGLIVGSLYMIITRQAPPEVAGPVGIVHAIGEVASTGIENLLFFTALLSINLGFINLLPLPALDGGRIAFFFLEMVRGKPLNPERENLIHVIGFALLMLLVLTVTYQDLARLDVF